MFNRNWLLIAALGGCLTLGIATSGYSQDEPSPTFESQPKTSPGQKESGATSGSKAEPEEGRPIDIAPAIQGVEAAIREHIPLENQEERERREQREIDDTNAQVAMAKWAKWAAFAAVGTVFLTGAGVLLIWRTLIHTRDAARAALAAVGEAQKVTIESQKQTALAEQSLQEAKAATRVSIAAAESQIEATRVTSRAYVLVNCSDFRIQGNSVSACVRLFNVGQTLAYNITTIFEIIIDPGIPEFALSNSADCPHIDIIDKNSSRYFSINTKSFKREREATPEDISVSQFFIIGQYEYFDVFRKFNDERFAFRWDADRGEFVDCPDILRNRRGQE